jgi:hypothetical protein
MVNGQGLPWNDFLRRGLYRSKTIGAGVAPAEYRVQVPSASIGRADGSGDRVVAR